MKLLACGLCQAAKRLGLGFLPSVLRPQNLTSTVPRQNTIARAAKLQDAHRPQQWRHGAAHFVAVLECVLCKSRFFEIPTAFGDRWTAESEDPTCSATPMLHIHARMEDRPGIYAVLERVSRPSRVFVFWIYTFWTSPWNIWFVLVALACLKLNKQ